MIQPRHFQWRVEDRVGVITLDRPERKNPLTFESYAELRDLFFALEAEKDIRAVVLCGAGGNFCSGGDVHEIIGPLTRMAMPELLAFTRMTGDVVKAMRHCPQPVIAAVDGVCAGAGAILAMACDLRYGAPDAKVAFLFVRVGLAGCDMGACASAAAHHRAGAGVRAPLYGALHERRGRPVVGILQPGLGISSGRSLLYGERAGQRPRRGARHDEEDAAPGMERGGRRGDRNGSPGSSDTHAEQGFPPRLRGFRGQEEAGLRRRLMDRFAHYGWPFFEPRHVDLARKAETYASENWDSHMAKTLTPSAGAWCRTSDARGS